jgi:hypothetical protein
MPKKKKEDDITVEQWYYEGKRLNRAKKTSHFWVNKEDASKLHGFTKNIVRYGVIGALYNVSVTPTGIFSSGVNAPKLTKTNPPEMHEEASQWQLEDELTASHKFEEGINRKLKAQGAIGNLTILELGRIYRRLSGSSKAHFTIIVLKHITKDAF